MSKTSVQTVARFTETYRLGNPFDLDNERAYQAWREIKLENYPQKAEQLIVQINDPAALTPAEFEAMQRLIVKTNMAVYASNSADNPDKKIPAKLGEQFGLTELDDNMGADDGVTSLKVVSGEWRGAYIPYTDRAIRWHTDGYYNDAEHQIRGLLLHCVSPAAKGGENALLDHEIAYIHLRDGNPDFIRALMACDAMTIPANIDNGNEIRAMCSGPVFSVMPDGNLHMRYTARTRSIEWKDDAVTEAAVKTLSEFLDSASTFIYRTTLQSGQGLISNNVLHDRSGFEDTATGSRLLYRLRYYQRIANS